VPQTPVGGPGIASPRGAYAAMEEVFMARTMYEDIAQRWLPTPVTPKSTPPHDDAMPMWPLVAVAIPAFAGLAAWFLRERGPVLRSTKVKGLMVSDVVTIGPSATLAQAARMMRDQNVGILPVIHDTKLVGVITDRDLVVRALAEGADPTLTVVGEFASAEPICVRPDTEIDEAMEVMAACQVGRLPVVNYNNELVGIVTLSSLALRSREERETLHTAQEVSRRSARAA
jgi:CBS domain-containing protein